MRAAKTKERQREKEDETGQRCVYVCMYVCMYVCVVELKEKPSEQGQPMKPTSLSRPGRPETCVKVYVDVQAHTKTRTDVCAQRKERLR